MNRVALVCSTADGAVAVKSWSYGSYSTTHNTWNCNPSCVSCYTPSVTVIGQHPVNVVLHLSDSLSLSAGRTWVLGFFKRFQKDVTDFLKQNSGQREIRVRRLIKVLWGQFKDLLSLSSRHEISIYLPCSLRLWRFSGY